MYRTLTSSVLSSDRPSQDSEQLLTRLGLGERFDEQPELVLAALRGPGAGLSREYLFVLSELSFYHAVKSQKREYFLASAVYAYAFIVGGGKDDERIDPLDPRLRLAANLYNLGLAQGLAGDEEATVVLEPGPRSLPFGKLEMSVDEKSFLWSGYRMARFISLGEYKVRGFLNRYRQDGVGAPLAAELAPVGEGPEAEAARKRIPPRLKVPVTALLLFDDVLTGIATGTLRGRLTVHAADEATTVDLGRKVPLELEPTAALAYQLEGAPVWDTELGAFISAFRPPFPEGLVMMHPYRPGRVPVVLVHGTASSPARWADIINELQNDPKLRGRIQFWLFTYNTSNPIVLSAADLRQVLQRTRKEIDPDGRDPALDQLVMIGHSQGGLLTRLMVTDSGTRYWDAVSNTPFDQVDLSPDTRALIQRAIFFERLPFVTRVVFIATPHRGSFRVSSFVLGLVRKLVTLPLTVVIGFSELGTKIAGLPKEAFTAVDNMRPGGRFVRNLATSPIAPGVKTHSIIPVKNDGPPEGQDDGVVKYESAHLEGVDSEKIVRSTHSTQSTPATILEIRRILYEHLGIACGLECEVPERVEAAMASVPPPAPPATKTEAVEAP
jgi:pimeloyl-ACP methyl ester carboxylesterase